MLLLPANMTGNHTSGYYHGPWLLQAWATLQSILLFENQRRQHRNDTCGLYVSISSSKAIKTLSCRWKTARRISAEAIASLTSCKHPSPDHDKVRLVSCSRSNRVRIISCGEPAKYWCPLVPRRVVMEGLSDRLKETPPLYVLPRPIWLFVFKECSHRQRTPEIGGLGEHWGLAPLTGPWLTP